MVSTTKGNDLLLEVTDKGPGIPEAELSLVFERFYRVDKARARRLGGAGLGLSIAKTIVEAHGGRIEAQSRLNQGTTMRLCLPDIVASEITSRATVAGAVGELR